MTTERDSRTRIVLSWLREDAHENAERILLRALDEVDTTPQRRPWWPARRSSEMNTFAKALVAAAAVVVVAVASINLLPGNRTGAGGPAPSARATPIPTATSTPGPTVVPSLPLSGLIPAGTYRMGTGPKIRVTVPAGWQSVWDGMGIRKHYEQPNEVTALHMWSPGLAVFTDACHSAGSHERIGPTVAALLSGLQAQKNSVLANPVDVTIAGVNGTRLELSSPAGLDLSQCSLEGYLQVWEADRGGYVTVASDGSAAVVYVADTPAGRLHLAKGVFNDRGASNPPATATDNAEAEGIWASIEYEE